MKFALSQEHRDLGRATRAALTRFAVPNGRLRDDDVHEVVRDLGWADPTLDNLSVGVLAEEAGRALLPGSWWIMLSGAGRHLSSAAMDTPALCWSTLPAVNDANWDGVLEGSLPDVFGVASRPQQLLFPSLSGVIAVDLSLPGVTTIPQRDGFDPSRTASTVHFQRVTTRRLRISTDDWQQTRTRALALLAAEATGVAQAMLEVATDHAKVRSQFGKPIGVFQAVAHPLADCYVDIELARSAWWWAMAALDSPVMEVPARRQAVATASVLAMRCLETASSASLQTLGAVGFTQEHSWHRHYRRAVWLRGYLSGSGPWQVLTAALTKPRAAQGEQL